MKGCDVEIELTNLAHHRSKSDFASAALVVLLLAEI